jgi:hypothetical protein
VDALYVSLVMLEFAHLPPLPAAFSSGPLAGVVAVVDATAIAIPRIADHAEAKKFYNMKSSTKEAVKVQLLVTLNGIVLHVSHVVPGAVHDVTLLRASELLDDIPLASKLLADKGYIGEEAQVVTPKKKPRGGELKAEEKKTDKEKNSQRAVVENSIHQLKRWAILGTVYRGKWRHDASLQKLTKIAYRWCTGEATAQDAPAAHPTHSEQMIFAPIKRQVYSPRFITTTSYWLMCSILPVRVVVHVWCIVDQKRAKCWCTRWCIVYIPYRAVRMSNINHWL